VCDRRGRISGFVHRGETVRDLVTRLIETKGNVASIDEVPVTIIKPSRGWISLKLGEVWEYRELLYFLTWRDIKVRYKQTVLGAAWAIIQPFFTTVVFSLFFGRLTQMPSDDIPYPIFSCAALVPWAFFANRLGQASTGMVTHAGLIKKIYFPRLAIPIARVLAGTVGFVLAFSGCLPHLSPIPAACFRSPGGRYMASTRLLGCLRVFDGSYWAPIRHLGQL
jgi:hypothetical protein